MLENFRQKMTKPIIGFPLLYYFADEMMITTADNTVSFLNFLVLKIFGIYRSNYRKVASSNTSCLEAQAGFFRLLMKGIFGPYVVTFWQKVDFQISNMR